MICKGTGHLLFLVACAYSCVQLGAGFLTVSLSGAGAALLNIYVRITIGIIGRQLCA